MESNRDIKKVYYIYRTDDVDKRQAPLDSSGASVFVKFVLGSAKRDDFILDHMSFGIKVVNSIIDADKIIFDDCAASSQKVSILSYFFQNIFGLAFHFGSGFRIKIVGSTCDCTETGDHAAVFVEVVPFVADC